MSFELPPSDQPGAIHPEPATGFKNPVTAYFKTVYAILTRPTAYFRELPVPFNAGISLFYAVVTHWLGSALRYLWQNSIGHLLQRRADDLFRLMDRVADVDSPGRSSTLAEVRERVVHWFWGTGSVLIDPFTTVFSVLFTTFWVWIGVRILVHSQTPDARERLSFETALAVVSLGMTPALLAGLPFVGTIVASIFTFIITCIAAREVYRIGPGRAVVVVMFPKLLLVGVIAGFFALITFGILRVFMSAYGW